MSPMLGLVVVLGGVSEVDDEYALTDVGSELRACSAVRIAPLENSAEEPAVRSLLAYANPVNFEPE